MNNIDYIQTSEKYRLLYVAITIASQDIKIFMSAFERVSDSIKSSKSEDMNTLKQLHDVNDILRSSL